MDNAILNPKNAFWNGELCHARKVIVKVGKSLRPTWWCAEFEGQERPAVEVLYGGQRFFLDNLGGSGWGKVTTGYGSPQYGHRSLPNDSEVVSVLEFSEMDRTQFDMALDRYKRMTGTNRHERRKQESIDRRAK